ncbi:MAG: SIMPL domain-containing protein [Patescibacteria group bacterium]|jgi:uncharacterized protein YggE
MKELFRNVVFILGTAVVLTAALYLIPWGAFNWGKLQLMPGSTVTVTGEAETQQQNQVATFTAGVESVNDNKDIAVAEVNEKVTTLTQAIKDFGIAEGDIKTQNVSIFQEQEPITEGGRQRFQPGQWRVNNSIEIKLRDIDRASELADMLASSGATNVYGPNFTLDNTNATEMELYEEALANAREKAGRMASLAGKKLGKVVSISEGGTLQGVIPMLERGFGGGGAPIEPGTGTVKSSVIVVFELQ